MKVEDLVKGDNFLELINDVQSCVVKDRVMPFAIAVKAADDETMTEQQRLILLCAIVAAQEEAMSGLGTILATLTEALATITAGADAKDKVN